MRSSRGFRDLSLMGMQSNSTHWLPAFSFGPYHLRHGVWACDDGNVVLGAACLGGVHIGGVTSGSGAVLQGCSVLGGFVSFKILDPSLVALLRGTFSVLGPPDGGTVYGLFSKEALTQLSSAPLLQLAQI